MVMPAPTLKEIGKQLHDWVDCTVLCNPVFTNERRACTWTGHLDMGQNLKYHILEGPQVPHSGRNDHPFASYLVHQPTVLIRGHFHMNTLNRHR